MTPLRVGGVAYLNAVPLLHGLAHRLPEGAGLVTATPARLAADLENGRLDVALAPTASWWRRRQTWQRIPGIGIACDGPADSVALFADRPCKQIERFRPDPSSRTSNCLAWTLLRDLWHAHATTHASPATPGPTPDHAFLLIGDPCLAYSPPPGWTGHDLGAAWRTLTGLPFVFAVWAAREGIDLDPVARALHQTWEANRPRLADLARAASERLRLPPARCVEYLTRTMRYTLGASEEEAIATFGPHVDNCPL